jgi:hypothetical protein
MAGRHGGAEGATERRPGGSVQSHALTPWDVIIK